MGLCTTRVKSAFVVLQASRPYLFLKHWKVMTKEEGLDFNCVLLISICCSVILHCVHTVNDAVFFLLPLCCQDLNNWLSGEQHGWCLITNSLTYTQTLLPSQYRFQKTILGVSIKTSPTMHCRLKQCIVEIYNKVIFQLLLCMHFLENVAFYVS